MNSHRIARPTSYSEAVFILWREIEIKYLQEFLNNFYLFQREGGQDEKRENTAGTSSPTEEHSLINLFQMLYQWY